MCHFDGHKTDATPSGGTSQHVQRPSHFVTFAKVTDGRKQPIRGLWIRDDRYYARLLVENPITGVKKTRRVPLIDKDGRTVQTVAQAVGRVAGKFAAGPLRFHQLAKGRRPNSGRRRGNCYDNATMESFWSALGFQSPVDFETKLN